MQKPFPQPEEYESINAEVEGEIADIVKESSASGKLRFAKRADQIPTEPNVANLLNDRQTTHGDFRTNARVSQLLKAVFRACEHWQFLDDVEKESMDMIALKFSRVLSGKSLERQHWEDIEGYARLALKECK